MSWRVVVITKRCKLECKLGYLVCRGEETKKVFIREISTLIIESTAVALTAALLLELINNKVNVLFCDDKHNPSSQLIPCCGRYNSSGMVKMQVEWTNEAKTAVWTEIVRNKIYRQYLFLKGINPERALLVRAFLEELEYGDATNREGHSAKVYFNTLFGTAFTRNTASEQANSVLNYGYAIILSAFNRQIVSCGYLTQIGLFHKNDFNYFNLSCDLMEPFRILVDKYAYSYAFAETKPDYKRDLQNILNETVFISGNKRTVSDAIAVYCDSVFDALNTGKIGLIKFYTTEK